jgi:alginate O-acetyltransferase complex protein AlgI
MDATSIYFPIAIIALVMAFHVSKNEIYRKLVFLSANIVFFASFMPSISGAIPISIFILGGFILLTALSNFNHPKILTFSVISIIASFILFKNYLNLSLFNTTFGIYSTIGISYILFRIVHLLVDTHGGAIKQKISLVQYFNYVCFFPVFVSGPIQTYQEFSEQANRLECISKDPKEVRDVFSRIMNGYVKIIIFSPLFLIIFQRNDFGSASQLVAQSNLENLLTYTIAIVCFYIHFYFSFSGYIDVIIGVARLFGFHLPENFNRPFAAKNFLDFWTRWHITLADWFRTYLFNPLLKMLLKIFANHRLANLFAIITFFITFLIMGLWHGASVIWFYYGIFLAFGTSVNKLYQVYMVKYYDRKSFKTIGENFWYKHLSQGMTFAYVAIAFTCFWIDAAQLEQLYGQIGAIGFLIVFISVSVSTGAVFVVSGIPIFTNAKALLPRNILKSFLFENLWLASKLLVIIAFLAIQSTSIPDTVYKAF